MGKNNNNLQKKKAKNKKFPTNIIFLVNTYFSTNT